MAIMSACITGGQSDRSPVRHPGLPVVLDQGVHTSRTLSLVVWPREPFPAAGYSLMM